MVIKLVGCFDSNTSLGVVIAKCVRVGGETDIFTTAAQQWAMKAVVNFNTLNAMINLESKTLVWVVEGMYLLWWAN